MPPRATVKVSDSVPTPRSVGLSDYEILDTFPAFRRFWHNSQALPVDQQIESWSRDYLEPWPELLQKQVDDYDGAGVDWRTVARTRIFPALAKRFRPMAEVHNRLLRAIPTAVRRCRDGLGIDFPVTCVIHVGVGCGAGWATTFGGTPAVLFGLENAAELGWSDQATVVALVEHEIAHLAHDHWRQRAGKDNLRDHRGPWWQLYEEGFATRCELRLGDIGFHHSSAPGEDWLAWCAKNRSRLAALFLKATASPIRVRKFFGSWYNVEGHINTGYFLGSEVIRDWESSFRLEQIALWTPQRVRRRAQSTLRRMATDPHGPTDRRPRS